MRLLILCREPRLYSCRRLSETAEMLGISLDILDPQRFILMLGQENSALYCNDEQLTSIQLRDYHAVLGRFGTSSTDMGCYVLKHFESLGIPTFNSSEAFRLARNKWQSLQQLASEGLPIPVSSISGNQVSSEMQYSPFTLPLVVKTLSGSQGVGVMLLENRATAQSVLDTLKEAKITTLQQEFIPQAQGEDIRAFVVGNEVVATMVRHSKNDDFRANIHQGGSASAIVLSEEECRLAVEATKAIGLDIAGVDLIRYQTGLAILEVNASPGLEMIEKVSGVDIAQKILTHLLEKLAVK